MGIWTRTAQIRGHPTNIVWTEVTVQQDLFLHIISAEFVVWFDEKRQILCLYFLKRKPDSEVSKYLGNLAVKKVFSNNF